MASFLADLRYAWKTWKKSPLFIAVSVLSLALGIGANTAIFTLINALILRDLPVRQPKQLVQLSVIMHTGTSAPFSFPMFEEVERGQRVFTGILSFSPSLKINVEINGTLFTDDVNAVTGNFYSELGATPLLGRLLGPDDVDVHGGRTAQVAVIGYEFWCSRFGGDPAAVGKQIRIEGQPFTIIGVTRKWFTGMRAGEPAGVTIPITDGTLVAHWASLDSRSFLWLQVVGRLKDGVTIEQASAQLQTFWPAALANVVPSVDIGERRQQFLSLGLHLAPAAKGVDSGLRSYFERPLYVLLGIVGLILLVTCVNLANLMLARAAVRSHEISVRVALGASRWRLARQMLTESLALSVAGALLGLAFAEWASRALVGFMTQWLLTPLTLDLRPDVRGAWPHGSCRDSHGSLLRLGAGLASVKRGSRCGPPKKRTQRGQRDGKAWKASGHHADSAFLGFGAERRTLNAQFRKASVARAGIRTRLRACRDAESQAGRLHEFRTQ